MIKIIFATLAIMLFMPASVLPAQENLTAKVPGIERRPDLQTVYYRGNIVIFDRGIVMPLGRILLVRRKQDCVALKFKTCRQGKKYYQLYTSYEYYHQGDGSCDFSRDNLKSGTGEFYDGGMGRFLGNAVQSKDTKRRIKIGELEIEWYYPATVYFKYGFFAKVELAPTPWSSISEINMSDPRIRWFRKGEVDERIEVPIDTLWRDESAGKTNGK